MFFYLRYEYVIDYDYNLAVKANVMNQMQEKKTASVS